MKRSPLSLPLLVSFVLFILLCVLLTYWALQFTKPSVRAVSIGQENHQSLDSKQAAMELFGGSGASETVSSFQLKGVVVANKGAKSVAILAMDGKPANTFTVGQQIAPGTTLQEISPTYVVLMENGVQKRIALPLPVNEKDGKALVMVPGKTSNKALPIIGTTPPLLNLPPPKMAVSPTPASLPR